MDTHLRDIFVFEVETQCECIVRGAAGVTDALTSFDTTGVWYHLQGILVAAANVSKMLWGSQGKREAERQPLRDYLGVPDSSALRDPDLRNDFEHFDQRLDHWHAEHPSANYMGRNIGPPDQFQISNAPSWFHHFDPTTALVTFWDHEASVQQLVHEAQRILGTIRSTRGY